MNHQGPATIGEFMATVNFWLLARQPIDFPQSGHGRRISRLREVADFRWNPGSDGGQKFLALSKANLSDQPLPGVPEESIAS